MRSSEQRQTTERRPRARSVASTRSPGLSAREGASYAMTTNERDWLLAHLDAAVGAGDGGAGPTESTGQAGAASTGPAPLAGTYRMVIACSCHPVEGPTEKK